MVKVNIPTDQKRLELDEIKKRQKQRKQNKPSKITNDMIYEILSDVLENQARIMNFLERGKFNG